MYLEIVKLLKKGKASRDNEEVRNALYRVAEYLEQVTSHTELRNQLIADQEYIFPVEREEVYQTFGLDYTFSTSGYLNQVLDILGVSNGKEYVRRFA